MKYCLNDQYFERIFFVNLQENIQFIRIYVAVFTNQTSLKWLTVAMPLLETSKRQDQSETSVRLERDYRDMEIWRMAYHSLTRQLERARDQRERAREEI